MDEFGTVIGPFTGGSGPPTGPAGGVLSGTYPNPGLGSGVVATANIAPLAVTNAIIGANAVTGDKIGPTEVDTGNIKDLAIQTAKIANSAVIGAKIATSAITPDKLAAGEDGEYSFLTADSPTTWASGWPPRIKFKSCRVSIIGDIGGVTDPPNPRVLGASDVNLGYLVRAQYIPVVAIDGNLADWYSYYELQPALPSINPYYLPDCRVYPPGSEIILINISAFLLTINASGGLVPNANRAIVNAADQNIVPGYSGRRFLTNGQVSGGWILIGTF
jgi:hypothetical protein